MEEWNMGLSRRKFTREFKLDAIERLESGVSVAAVARALEVSPTARVNEFETSGHGI
jgi:transposase-like protein